MKQQQPHRNAWYRHTAGRRRHAVAVVLSTTVVFGALLTIPRSGAAFTNATGNVVNVVGADSLDPPTGLTATSEGTITIDWTASTDAYADGHRILRSTSPGGPYVQIAEVTPRTAETYVDTPPVGTYYYVARAFTTFWESTDSNEDPARPFDCPSDPDLRACLRFDEDLGGTYADASGYGNTVTHTNGQLIPGISDSAVDGDATRTYAMADSVSLDLTDAMTLEAWVRFDSLPATGRVGILDNDGQYSLFVYSGTGLRCSNGPHNLPHVPVATGTWFHVACSWDGATLTMYFDGMPVASMASTGTIATVNTEPVSLLNSSPVFDEPMDGAVDSLRVWHVGRTQAQICADAGLSGC